MSRIRMHSGQRSDGRYIAWIYFADKGLENDQNIKDALASALSGLDDRTRWRRSKTLGNHLVDIRDVPVFPEYVAQVKSVGVQFRTASKWLNAVSVSASYEQLEKIEKFPFVKKIDPVFAGKRIEFESSRPISLKQSFRSFGNNYGQSYGQLEQINVIAAHEAGYTGAGIRVLILDTGFFKDHEAIHEEQIIDEWDFINDDGNTQNEPGDYKSQHSHGTNTLSVLGGWKDGQLYGPAYEAEFLLAKTEDVPQEQPIEEDWYVAGLEWGEGLGADIVSSSLGYIDWYEFDDLDGLTAVTTTAVNTAIENGMVVVTAAGNSGAGGIIAPADAFDVITCGAVDADDSLAYFSSWGPTADGRIKPEVCARGYWTYCASSNGVTNYTYAMGTSLSTPLVAGAAAIILSAHPEWTPEQVRGALMMTANNSENPNNLYGWGIIDVMAAINYQPQAPIALFTAEPASGEVPLTVNFSNQSLAGGDSLIVSWNWFFGNGDVSIQQDPVYTYYTTGTYTVALTVFNEIGISDTKVVENYIVVTEPEPFTFSLSPPYPNPFNSLTQFMVSIPPENNHVVISLIDLTGKEIIRFLDGVQKSGTHYYKWDGSNFPSGIYLIKLDWGGGFVSRKVCLLK